MAGISIGAPSRSRPATITPVALGNGDLKTSHRIPGGFRRQDVGPD
jgi:hypothetical protein